MFFVSVSLFRSSRCLSIRCLIKNLFWKFRIEIDESELIPFHTTNEWTQPKRLFESIPFEVDTSYFIISIRYDDCKLSAWLRENISKYCTVTDTFIHAIEMKKG